MNGAGGGRIEGMRTAMMPCPAERRHRAVRRSPNGKRARTSASPPLRPRKYSTKEAAIDRASQSHVKHEPRFVLRHHPHDEEIGDLGEREERRIQEGDEEKAGGAERECQRLEPADDSAHRINR